MLTHLKRFKHPFSDDRLLWEKIDAYNIDDADSSFKFSHRLARENLWTTEYTDRVIEEYKKFVFLGCVDGPVTPSLDVDQCWHLHMIYTEDYWKGFCKILNTEFHHGPTKGGKVETNKYIDIYQKTKDAYRDYFGEPPHDIWPISSVRFRPVNFAFIDLNDHWVIPVGDTKSLLSLLIKQIKRKLW